MNEKEEIRLRKRQEDCENWASSYVCEISRIRTSYF